MGTKAITFISLFCCVLLYAAAGINNIDPGEVGILVKMYGSDRGMQDETMDTGMHWVDPLAYDVIVYDTRLNEYPVEDLPSSTKDGQPIMVDLSLVIGLIPDKVPDLHELIGPDWYERLVLPTLNSSIKNKTSTQLSDQIYTGDGRQLVQNLVEEQMVSVLTPYGIKVTTNLRAADFTNSQFINTLEQKAEAQQKVTIAQRQAEQAEQDAIKMANLAEGEKQKRIKAAEAQREESKLQGEGQRLQQEEQAKGILAIAQAEAEGTRLKAMALSGAGSEALVSIEWAKNMGPNVQVLGYPLGAPGTTGIFNVDGILGDALKIKEAAK